MKVKFVGEVELTRTENPSLTLSLTPGRVASSPTRTVEVIREAVKLMPTAEKSDAEVSALGRRLREIDKKLKNLMSVMEAGGAGVRSLITRLQELETERANIVEQQRQVQAKVAETRLERPDAGQVQEWFQNFLRLWDCATEEEKNELLPLIVGRVEMTEKERGFCAAKSKRQEPRSLRKSHSDGVVFNNRERAGRLVVVNYPLIQFPDFEVSRISRKVWKLGEAAQAQE